MDSGDLQQCAISLINKATSGLDDFRTYGYLSVSIYDTAWVSMIAKEIDGSRQWLFPQSFQYILAQQKDDGSWESYVSRIDGIINTGACLLAIKRHLDTRYGEDGSVEEDLKSRIQKATAAFQTLLESWDVSTTNHIGFEIIVPALLEYLHQEGLNFDFPQKESLLNINRQKLAKFKPEYLYLPKKTTILYSLEGFIGKINFNRIRHQKVFGCFMGSPASTAAYLMNVQVWDQDSEDYLGRALSCKLGNSSESVPSTFPTPMFELPWCLTTLLSAGFDLPKLAATQLQDGTKFIEKTLEEDGWLASYAPQIEGDADETAKVVPLLKPAGKSKALRAILDHFHHGNYFKTFPNERDYSLSANCNVLVGLLHADDPRIYEKVTVDCAVFLCQKCLEVDANVKDKWHHSPFYPLMLMTQAFTLLSTYGAKSNLSSRSPELMEELVPQAIQKIAQFTLQSQNENGSIGPRGFYEETAYAVVLLAYVLQLSSAVTYETQIRVAIRRGREFLLGSELIEPERLWVGKISYGTKIVSESYILAALNVSLHI